MLRIHFLEAQDLEGKDKYLGGLIKGKSDPYGVVQIGNQLFQSKTIKQCLQPKWNEVFEVRGHLWAHGHTDKTDRHATVISVLATSSLVFPQALVYEHSGQHLEIELFDEDPDKDDFLGRYRILTGPPLPCLCQRIVISVPASLLVLISVEFSTLIARQCLGEPVIKHLASVVNVTSDSPNKSQVKTQAGCEI